MIGQGIWHCSHVDQMLKEGLSEQLTSDLRPHEPSVSIPGRGTASTKAPR